MFLFLLPDPSDSSSSSPNGGNYHHSHHHQHPSNSSSNNHHHNNSHNNKALGRTLAGVLSGAAANIRSKFTNLGGSVGDLHAGGGGHPSSGSHGYQGSEQCASSIPLTVPGASLASSSSSSSSPQHQQQQDAGASNNSQLGKHHQFSEFHVSYFFFILVLILSFAFFRLSSPLRFPAPRTT